MMSSKHLRSRNHAPVKMGGLNVAKQLYLPANFMRILELLFSLIAFGLVLGWNSGGVTYRDLSQGDVNIINNLNFFLAVSVISGVAAGVVCLIVLLELRSFTSLLDLILSGTFSLFWVIASIVMYVGLSSIAYTDSIKEADVTFTNLEAALGIGFANGVYFGGSAWFALSAHREAGEPAFGPSRLSAHLPSDILNDTEQRNKIFSPEATTF